MRSSHRYVLNGERRECFYCGEQYLECRCYDKPRAVVNDTPRYKVGDLIHIEIKDLVDADVEVLEVRYPDYTNGTSWTGAPAILTAYRLRFLRGKWPVPVEVGDDTDWFTLPGEKLSHDRLMPPSQTHSYLLPPQQEKE